tara:strand:- start:639 stop:1010 length:372 start_codon:yes stop_codon:yes gene_type:complete
MILRFFRRIYWRFHVLIQPITADSESAKILGSSSLFTMATLFWLISIYKSIAKFYIVNPLLDRPKVGIVFILALAISVFIILTTNKEIENWGQRQGFLYKYVFGLLSLIYVVGSYIVFFGFTL